MPITLLSGSPLLGMSFDALQSEPLFDGAVDVVCQVIHDTGDDNLPDSMPVIEQIYPRLLTLREALKRCGEGDNDTMRGYCRIFTEAGEAYLSLILQHPDAFLGLVEGIVECTAYPDLDIVPMTLPFWSRLADHLDSTKQDHVRPKFVDIYRKLVDVMIGHLHYPADLSSWNAEEKDEFRYFRHYMGDTLK